jgi:signal transduction histidine kinase
MHYQNQEIAIFYLLICTLVFIILCLIISFLVYKYNQNKISYDLDIKNLKTSHENELLQTKLLIQEQTFQNISREIHDNIGQKLSFAKLQLNSIVIPENKHDADLLSDIINIITHSLDDLRDLSKSLNADYIQNNGLILALENQIFQLGKSGKHQMKLKVTGESQFLDVDKELILFRITQEALNNIIKHADATEITINLHYSKADLVLKISDNGIGFNVPNNKEGQGLTNIKKRTEYLNGFLNIESIPTQGTFITIKMPLYEQTKCN